MNLGEFRGMRIIEVIDDEIVEPVEDAAVTAPEPAQLVSS